MNSPGRRHAGERVQLARAQLGLSQAELADKAGVNATTLSFLETGRRWPRLSSQIGITKALGWPDGELERIARSYAPEQEPEAAASVTVLLAAFDAGEKTILASSLSPGLKRAMIAEWRQRNTPARVAEAVELERRERSG